MDWSLWRSNFPLVAYLAVQKKAAVFFDCNIGKLWKLLCKKYFRDYSMPWIVNNFRTSFFWVFFLISHFSRLRKSFGLLDYRTCFEISSSLDYFTPLIPTYGKYFLNREFIWICNQFPLFLWKQKVWIKMWPCEGCICIFKHKTIKMLRFLGLIYENWSRLPHILNDWTHTLCKTISKVTLLTVNCASFVDNWVWFTLFPRTVAERAAGNRWFFTQGLRPVSHLDRHVLSG